MEQTLPNTLTGNYTGKAPVYDLGGIATTYGYKNGNGLVVTYRNVLKEATENTKQIDELVSVGNALEEIKQQLKRATLGEPMSAAGVNAINYAVEQMLARVGIKAQCKVSLENYHTNSSKREALELAIEGFSDGVRAVAMAIGRLLKKIFMYIYEDIENAARGAAATARRAVRIQDAAQKLISSKLSLAKGNITRGSLCEAFNENGVTMGFEKIKSEYTKVMEVFNTRYSQKILSGSVITMANAIGESMNSDKIAAFDLVQAHKASDRALNYLKRNGFEGFKESSKGDDNTVHLESILPFGNAFFTAVFTKENGFLTGFGSRIENEKVTPPTHIPPLTVPQIKELASIVESQMNRGIYRDYKKIKRDITKMGNIVSKQCDDIVKYQRSSESGTIPSLNFLKKASEGVKDLVVNLYGYGGYTNRCVLLYCE